MTPTESLPGTMTPIDCSGSITDLSSHLKNFNEACTLIWDYADNREFPTFSFDAGAGMEICRDHLPGFDTDGTETPNIHCGLILYFCCSEGQFFLGYRIKKNMDHAVPQFPPADDVTYYLSKCDFVFDPADIASAPTLVRAITEYRNVCSCDEDPETVTKEDIKDFGNAFIDKFGNDSIMNFPIGFFHFKQLNDLLTQNDGASDSRLACTGIRFYWGYSDSATPGNKIKLVAFGIDGYGYNVITTHEGGQAVMLEKSWPPF